MELKLNEKDIEILTESIADKVIEKLREDPPFSRLVTVEELAEILQVSPQWIYDRTRDRTGNGIPRVKIGKYVRFNVAEVLDWLKNQQ